MKSKTGQRKPGTQLSFRQTSRFKKIIRGKGCYLKQFEENDRQLEDLLLGIFNEKPIEAFLNREYTRNKTRTQVRRWIRKKLHSPVDVWYSIRTGGKCTGYVCFKWRKHYDKACEISTAIGAEFRGLRLGFETSGILIEYIRSLQMFDRIIAYVHVKNKTAARNIRKLNFRKDSRLHKTVTVQFYGEPSSGSGERVYDIYTYPGK